MESELYIALSLKLHRISQHRQPCSALAGRRRAFRSFAFRVSLRAEAVVPRLRPGRAFVGPAWALLMAPADKAGDHPHAPTPYQASRPSR
jgi:hypothetical protein